MRITLYFLFVIMSVPLNAKISGIVIDSTSGAPLNAATVRLLDFQKYCYTDDAGEFYFDDLSIEPETLDTLILHISHVGFFQKQVKVPYPPKSDSLYIVKLKSKSVRLEELVVSGKNFSSEIEELNDRIRSVSNSSLQLKMSNSVSDIINGELGVSSQSMGPATARPVVRGMTGARVQVAKNGELVNDLSATSADHAVAIDAAGVDEVSLVSGAKTLIYTGSTSGGVINLHSRSILDKRSTSLIAQLLFESMNQGISGNMQANYDWQGFNLFGSYSRKKTSELTAPNRKLENTSMNNRSIRGGASFKTGDFKIGGAVEEFYSEYGIPGGFVGAHPNGVDIKMLRRSYKAESNYGVNKGSLQNIELSFARTYYKHTEYEYSGAIGAQFVFRDYFGRVNFNLSVNFLDSLVIGSFYNHRDFKIGGYVFTPPTVKNEISNYIFTSKRYSNIETELSMRHSYLVYDPVNDLESNIGEIRNREFSLLSYAGTFLLDISDNIKTGITLSRSTRAPGIEELYSEGPHLAAYSFETGNPALAAETGYVGEYNLFFENKELFAAFVLFYNKMDNYITPRHNGDTNWATLLPIYATASAEANIYGFESKLDWNFLPSFSIMNKLSYTKGEFAKGGDLPMIPPLKGMLTLNYEHKSIGAGMTMTYASDQENTDIFEERTPGYTVFGLFGFYKTKVFNSPLSIYLNLENLTNRKYFNHLSRIKSIMPEPGINLKLNVKVVI